MLKGILLISLLHRFSFSLYFLNIDQSLEISQDTLWNYIELNTTGIQDDHISVNLLIKYRQFQAFPLLTLNFDHFPEFLNDNISTVNSNYTDFYSYENQITEHSIILNTEVLMHCQNVYIGVAYPNYKIGLIKYKLTLAHSNGNICNSNCSGSGKCDSLDSCLCNTNFAARNCGISPSLLYLNKSTQIQVNNDKIGYFEADLSECIINLGKENSVIINCTYIGESGIIYLGKPANNLYDLPNSQNYLSSISFNSSSSAKTISFDTDVSDKRLLFLAIYNTITNSGRRISFSCQLSKKKTENSGSSSMTVILIAIICSIVSFFLVVLILYMIRRLSRVRVANETQLAKSGINLSTIQHTFPIKPLKELRNKSEEMKICVICMDNMTPRSAVRKMMCGHIFHAHCIDEWFAHHKYCCVCKRNCEPQELMISRECNHEMGEDAGFITHNSIEPGFHEITANVHN